MDTREKLNNWMAAIRSQGCARGSGHCTSRKPRRRLTVVLLGLLWAGPAWTGLIEYQATDLGTPGGQDRWRYDYVLSSFSFLANESFSIGFQWNLYKDLGNPQPSVNGDWDVSVLERDASNLIDGSYDGFALVGSPSLANVFSVDFTWIGGGVPGAQPYLIFDEFFDIVATGTTEPYTSSGNRLVPPFMKGGLGGI